MILLFRLICCNKRTEDIDISLHTVICLNAITDNSLISKISFQGEVGGSMDLQKVCQYCNISWSHNPEDYDLNL
jgi:hypothetical protein